MYFGVTIQPTAVAPVDSLFPSAMLRPASAPAGRQHDRVGFLSQDAWVASMAETRQHSPPGPVPPPQGPDPPWLEARAAVSAAPVIVTLTENHTRHMGESPRGCPIPCSLFAYDVSTLIRTV